MIILALDTSAAASAALVDADTEEVLAEWTEFSARKHAELLGPAIRTLLERRPAPGRVVVGVGPGPFTGLRAGIATGIGFALGAGIPVDGLPSHDALALRALRTHAPVSPVGPAPQLRVATDARRKEVYWTEYAGLDAAGVPEVLAGPAVSLPADLHVVPDQGAALRYGRGFLLFPEELGDPTGTAPADLEPTAGDLGIVAARMIAAGRPLLPPVPLYLREPDAQPSARRTTSLR
ncbi:tRNA (adenosine(37)-N6)-threonylcarbamoyltransferase complex dimerization subunit type 1 TsaB [Brevibacterium sp. NPDC049920]|uniref:tRNA (adenosine(37)-N6)-threonylcarbamoyltransferase complex dimerization subunit type 1 TsaB n=1 Tax=Brevibacterium sp. NPDC049920 TaxID=3155279 RepID=UPI0033EDD822